MHPHSEQSSQNESFWSASPLSESVLQRKLHEQYAGFGGERVNRQAASKRGLALRQRRCQNKNIQTKVRSVFNETSLLKLRFVQGGRLS